MSRSLMVSKLRCCSLSHLKGVATCIRFPAVLFCRLGISIFRLVLAQRSSKHFFSHVETGGSPVTQHVVSVESSSLLVHSIET